MVASVWDLSMFLYVKTTPRNYFSRIFIASGAAFEPVTSGHFDPRREEPKTVEFSTRTYLRNLSKPTMLSGNRKSRDFDVSMSEYALYAHYAAYVSALVQRYRADTTLICGVV